MADSEKPIERTVIAVSMTMNDRNKLKKLANYHETSASAFISRCIKEEYNKIKDEL